MDAARNRMLQLAGRGWDQVKSPLYRNAIFIMLTSVVGSGLGFFFWILVSNKYSQEDMGAAVTLFSTLGFLAALGNLGIGVGLIRFMPDAESQPVLVNTGLTLAGLVTFVLSLVFLVLLPFILPTMSFVLQEPLYIVTIVACSVALGMAPILDSAAIAVRRADFQTYRITIFAVLKIPLALGVVAFLRGRAGIFLSLAAAFGISVVLLGEVFLRRAIPGFRPRPDFRFNRIRPLLGFSLGNYVAAAIGAAGVLLPTALIYDTLGNAGAANAAYFYVALVVANLLYIIPGATFTSFYAEASHKDMDRRRGERQAIFLSLGLLLPAIAVMWVFADLMLRWFGDPAYADEAVLPLRILTFASIPAFLNGILSTRVRVRKRTIPLIVATTISTAITLGLGWILLQNPDLGIDGLAYAYVLGQVAATPYLYFEARGAYESVPTEPVLGQPLE
jgi:O-antigen/teichoic acid export membrane protein